MRTILGRFVQECLGLILNIRESPAPVRQDCMNDLNTLGKHVWTESLLRGIFGLQLAYIHSWHDEIDSSHVTTDLIH